MLVTTPKIKSLLGIFSIAIAINGIAGSTLPTNAQPTSNQDSPEIKESSNNGLPFHRRDGGTRGSCLASNREFVAIVPDTAVSLTASLNPQLYFHVPATNRSQTIEFVLRDQNDRLVYENLIETKGESGIMSIEIPLSTQERAKTLDSGANYRWYLSHICNPEKRSQDVVIEGWIEYQELSGITLEKLNTLSSDEQANFYQQQGLWYDALAIAAKEKKAKQQDIAETKWSELLTGIGLEEFAGQPLIN